MTARIIPDRSIWKNLRDICRSLEREVVQADQNAVFRDLKVLLDIVGLLRDCEPIGIQRVFGCIR